MTDNGTIWADKFIKREYLPAGELAQRFNIHNPRSHPEAQREATESSLDTIGWIDEVSLSTNGDGPPSLIDNPAAVMFDGHERVEIALVRGGTETLVPVRWYQLTPEETDFALLVKDQSAAMAQIVPEKMAALIERAKAMTQAPGLQGLMERLKEQVADGLLAGSGNGDGQDTEPKIDKADELQEIWQVKVGDLWECGPHRVICGDCTDRAVVERVMGGEKIDLLLTDIPYDVAQRGRHNSYGSDLTQTRDDNFEKFDKDFDPLPFLEFWIDIIPKSANWFIYVGEMFQGTKVYLFLDTKTDICSAWIWVKKFAVHNIRGVGFAKAYELAIYAWNKGHYYDPLFGVDGYNYGIYASNEGGRSYNHPTGKPIALFERHIKQLSKNNSIIVDPFLGSGTTLIACHNLNRCCRGIEIEPKYVSVTLQRFLDHTGIQPRLLKTVEA